MTRRSGRPYPPVVATRFLPIRSNMARRILIPILGTVLFALVLSEAASLESARREWTVAQRGALESFADSTYTERLSIDAAELGASLKPFWAAIGFDRFHDIRLPEIQPVWARLGELQLFRWLRGHGIFRKNELARENWRSFPDQKQCLDTILGVGIRPIVELSCIPTALANPDHPLGFGGDVEGWADLVSQFVRFLLAEYGADEVRQWPFEFWNEPDHHFWSGDQELNWQGHGPQERMHAYCRMYDRTLGRRFRSG